MYEDLARSQERGLPERLAWSVVIPSLLVTSVLQGIRIARAEPRREVEIPVHLQPQPAVYVEGQFSCPMVVSRE